MTLEKLLFAPGNKPYYQSVFSIGLLERGVYSESSDPYRATARSFHFIVDDELTRVTEGELKTLQENCPNPEILENTGRNARLLVFENKRYILKLDLGNEHDIKACGEIRDRDLGLALEFIFRHPNFPLEALAQSMHNDPLFNSDSLMHMPDTGKVLERLGKIGIEKFLMPTKNGWYKIRNGGRVAFELVIRGSNNSPATLKQVLNSEDFVLQEMRGYPVNLKKQQNIYNFEGEIWSALAIRGYVYEADIMQNYRLSSETIRSVMNHLDLCVRSSSKRPSESILYSSASDNINPSGGIYYLPSAVGCSNTDAYFLTPSGFGFRKADGAEFRLSKEEYALLRFMEHYEGGAEIRISTLMNAVFGICQGERLEYGLIESTLAGIREKIGRSSPIKEIDWQSERRISIQDFNFRLFNDYLPIESALDSSPAYRAELVLPQ